MEQYKNNYQKLRGEFFKFFGSKSYSQLPSSNLIVENDPSLLFTSAGMVQFKDIFLKIAPAPVKRAVTIQKCLRVGGKHNDLENVGFTSRHNTFFEMMGHFAFHDTSYPKKNIIQDAFDFLTKICKLDEKRFWITVDHNDKECIEIWKNILGEHRIIKETSGENFWSMGDIGPCGPCTEILYDINYNPEEIITPKDVLSNCERFLEIWNIVFMCKIKTTNGLEDMEGFSIDTGMGLERLLSVMENKSDNFSTSVFTPIIEHIRSLLPSHTPEHILRICGDHLRSAYFLLSEGLEPGNTKHGYILKKLIRRAVFYYYNYRKEPLLCHIIPTLVDVMGDDTMIKVDNHLIDILSKEEAKNINLLSSSQEIIGKNINKESSTISGSKIFYLYDTCGVQLNLLKEYADINTINLDIKGFEEEMEKQRAKSGQKIVLPQDHNSEFIGYHNSTTSSVVEAVYSLDGDIPTDDFADDRLLLITKSTVFFPESGGQVGDLGTITINNVIYQVYNTTYCNTPQGVAIAHHIYLSQGVIPAIGSVANLQINEHLRNNAAANHSAVHMLESSITHLTGKNEQKGSKVYHDRFRLDFTPGRPLNKDDLSILQEEINDLIAQDIPSEIKFLNFNDAVSEGYMFLQNSYYGDEVRVVNIGNGYSKALCCGTHVKRTGDIIGLQITGMRHISNNTYRIEAIAGSTWSQYSRKALSTINNLSTRCNINFDLQKMNADTIAQNILKSLSGTLPNNREQNQSNSLILDSQEFDNDLSVISILCEKIQIEIYDVYKHKKDIVILVGENNGILIGSENHNDSLDQMVTKIGGIFPITGHKKERLFRGKINNNKTSIENYKLIKDSIDK